MIMGLFLRDGRIIGLFRVFRPPRIPLGISVRNSDLEIVGVESRLGLIMGVSLTPEVLLSLQASTFVSELFIRLTSEWGKRISAIKSRYGG